MEKTKDKVSCAYKEIYEILKIFPKELVDRIPKYKLDYIKQNMNESYEYNITKETFDGKTMLDETAAILAILFRDYWATEVQREKIIRKQKNDRLILEEQKKLLYDTENILKKQDICGETEVKEEVNEMVVYKANFITRVFNKIKKFLKIK